MPRSSRSKKRTSSESIEEVGPSQRDAPDENEEEDADATMMFSQQMPELSQPAVPAKEREKANLSALDPHVRDRIVTTLSRLLLFKALAGDTIDRTKVFKEACGDRGAPSARITTAVFEEAKTRLSDVFGFDLVQVPKCMEDNLPKVYQNRYYVINRVREDGSHSKDILGVHPSASVDRGLLMLVLSFAYCRGEIRRGHRWISAEALYRLLNGVDENIPGEPPASSSSGGAKAGPGRRRGGGVAADDEATSSGPYGTPDVDAAIERYVHMDYLLRERVVPVGAAPSDAGTVEYAMGPRAALEVGRKQVICFCAEVLGEQPDPTMLAELEDGEEEEGEGTEENAGEVEVEG